MKRFVILAVVVIITCLFAISHAVHAQKGSGIFVNDSIPVPTDFSVWKYDPKTETTINGQLVTDYLMWEPKDYGNKGKGLYFIALKTSKGLITVFLSPKGFIDKHNIAFEPGDMIEVKGSQMTWTHKFDGNLTGPGVRRGDSVAHLPEPEPQKTGLVGAEIKKGDKVLKLRDSKGAPLW